MNKAHNFTLTDPTVFRIQMLNWASRFNIFCLLENPAGSSGQRSFDWMLAAGAAHQLKLPAGTALESLKNFSDIHTGKWIFGHFAYDLKNEIFTDLQSVHADRIGFADLHFFVPEVLLQVKGDCLRVEGIDPVGVYKAILDAPERLPPLQSIPDVQHRLSRDAYISRIEILKGHIQRGDCYEINFCQEFYVDKAILDPVSLYNRLAVLSPNPFAAFYRVNQQYCCCASPERYLQLSGTQLISQPIKGTSKRMQNDPEQDRIQQEMLLNSAKERSENVMVVDLVRNDLSRICTRGSVKVDELFGIYSFPQVHQMISTVAGEVHDDTDWTEIIKATFPMGSMTGAPKKRVLQLIEQYEESRRGLFSGAIGYRDAGGNFDFNVIIRSLMYNYPQQYLSFQTGSAITAASDASAEYEECLLKAEAIRQCLSGQ